MQRGTWDRNPFGIFEAQARPHLAELLFWLPLAPSVNDLYVETKYEKTDGTHGRRRVATPELREYAREATEALACQFAENARPLWSAASEIGYMAHIFVSSSASDLSNRLKAMEDMVCAFLGLNDNKIVEQHSIRHIDKTDPHTVLCLYLLATRPTTLLKRKQTDDHLQSRLVRPVVYLSTREALQNRTEPAIASIVT